MGVVFVFAFEHVALGVVEGDAATFALVEAGVVVDHEVFGGVVGDFPEADDLAFGSGDREGTTESVNAFAVGSCAEAGFACGEGDTKSS
jgi:hypothetical protein